MLAVGKYAPYGFYALAFIFSSIAVWTVVVLRRAKLVLIESHDGRDGGDAERELLLRVDTFRSVNSY